jgi:hypothetical protein
LAEVEGDHVFAQLLAEVGEPHLRVVQDPEGTRDLRGIDVSIAYDDRKLTVVEQRSHVVHLRCPPGTSSRSCSASTTPPSHRAAGRAGQ